MLPRWHIVYGALFTLALWIVAPTIKISYLLLVFFASFLIDFDHYWCAVQRTKTFSLFHAFEYHRKGMVQQHNERKRGIRRRGDFHIFHTIEFHLFIALLGIFWTPFFYIFIGMAFHSLLDIYGLLRSDYMYRREFFFTNWLRKRFD